MPDTSSPIPLSLADVEAQFGQSVALQLMQLFGGLDVRFSKTPKPEMVQVMGMELAQEVCDFLRGQQFYVPHGRVGQRHQEVKQLQAKDLPQGEIARQLGLSVRHVRRLSLAPVSTLPLFPDLKPQSRPKKT